MTGLSNALQKLIFERLTTYAGVTALVGSRIADMPQATLANPCITFGASDIVTEEQDCIIAQTETVQIDVWSTAEDGKRECKAICAAVKNALHLCSAEPEEGALALMQVTLIRIMEDPDGRTVHGVVQVECQMEEAV